MLIRLRIVIVIGCFAAVSSLEAAQPTPEPKPRIELHSSADPARASINVLGLDARELAAFDKLSEAEKSTAFHVVVQSGLADPPPIVGEFSIKQCVLRFLPRYPLEPGLRYRAVLDRSRLPGSTGDQSKPVSLEFPVVKFDTPPTTVVRRIYPTSNRLPENQLKFYLHFSAPMSRGEAYRHIHLIDESGREIEAPFLELGQELWDADMQRFTLLCDPGRVKRGLKPREELGPVLREGHTYTLVVDANWRDATRTPLAAGARKKFSVGPPDDIPIDPARWQFAPPLAGSVAPLVVRFGEPLDQALAQRVIRVTTASGEKVPGSIRTCDHESSWQFTPQRPWHPGGYLLMAETTLEDLAGNSIGRPFEVDELKPVAKQIETESVSIPFTVSSSR